MSAVGDARKRQEEKAAGVALYDVIADTLSRHNTAPDYRCTCGYDCFGGTAAYSLTLFEAHLTGSLTVAVDVHHRSAS